MYVVVVEKLETKSLIGTAPLVDEQPGFEGPSILTQTLPVMPVMPSGTELVLNAQTTWPIKPRVRRGVPLLPLGPHLPPKRTVPSVSLRQVPQSDRKSMPLLANRMVRIRYCQRVLRPRLQRISRMCSRLQVLPKGRAHPL